MAKIKEIFSNDDYYPFLLFCESHGYEDMADLAKCQFQKLRSEADIPPLLVSKIKIIFVSYCRAHAAEFTTVKKSAGKPTKSGLAQEEIQKELETYFQNNADKLIHITDISKFIGKKIKRGELLKILEQAPWCKAVDSTTFFYSH